MGQNSSKPRNEQENQSSATETTAAAGASSTQPDDTPVSDSPTSPRRSSVRKSFLNLVRPSGIRSRVSSLASNSGETRRSSWRNSRRVSKLPQDAASTPALSSPSTVSASSSSTGLSTAPTSPVDKGKQPERTATDTDAHHDDDPIPTSIAADVPSTEDSPILPDVQEESSSTSRPSTSTPETLSESVPLPATTSPAVATTPAPTPAQPATRHFPPPGTLVVVQGIVHTTDVSRPTEPAAPTPPPPTTTPPPLPASASDASIEPSPSVGTRNRLSALLRPRSASSRRSSAAIPDSHSISTPPSEHAHVLSSSEHVPTRPNTPAPSDHGASAPRVESTPNEARSPAISSSSIDVLGTLLSVAAAATAASLLTGSSEPILSSGLAPPSAPPAEPSPPPSNPVPHGPPPPYPSPTVPIVPDHSPASRAERMRHAWGTIRERLGLRPSASNTEPPNPLTGQDSALPSNHADAREMMLAEMARAFNIGLGLNGLGTNGGTSRIEGSTATPRAPEAPSDAPAEDQQQQPPTTAPPPIPIPPEGSFERFLVDLQVDLRRALTQPEDERQSRPSSVLSEAGNEASEDDHAVDDVTTSSGHDTAESTAPVEYSDTESESDVEHEDDFHSAHDGAPPSQTPLPTEGTERISASGRINWWRLYRFPAITSPRVAPNSPPGAATNPPQAPLTSTPPVAPTDASTSPANPPSSVPSTHPPNAPQSVVPVIVVGLQSVSNNDWRAHTHDHPEHEHPHHHHHHHHHPRTGNDVSDVHGESDAHADEFSGEDDFDAFGDQNVQDLGQEGEGNGTRGRRGWQRRAASALRNLRPSRRTAGNTAGNVAGDVPVGSRTFLIYVIGGYYPPDHSIVTGGPNNFDSFEALLELADLLGQVKTPTVSKDEIEKSGLEIIKVDKLREYEAAGKVASNCVDRCLICLDDYEEEQELRIMSCRHTFHMKCVDEWLQKGRNNCPACRSTGVNAESTSSPASPPVVS